MPSPCRPVRPLTPTNTPHMTLGLVTPNFPNAPSKGAVRAGTRPHKRAPQVCTTPCSHNQAPKPHIVAARPLGAAPAAAAARSRYWLLVARSLPLPVELERLHLPRQLPHPLRPLVDLRGQEPPGRRTRLMNCNLPPCLSLSVCPCHVLGHVGASGPEPCCQPHHHDLVPWPHSACQLVQTSRPRRSHDAARPAASSSPPLRPMPPRVTHGAPQPTLLAAT